MIVPENFNKNLEQKRGPWPLPRPPPPQKNQIWILCQNSLPPPPHKKKSDLDSLSKFTYSPPPPPHQKKKIRFGFFVKNYLLENSK